MGKIFQAIDKQIIRPRVIASEQEGFNATQKDINSFYSQGSPKYHRTGAYGRSPESTGISGGNGNYHYNIHLNDPSYSTGSYSGHKVLEEAQYNGSGILGKSGTWSDSQRDIEEAIRKNFSN